MKLHLMKYCGVSIEAMALVVCGLSWVWKYSNLRWRSQNCSRAVDDILLFSNRFFLNSFCVGCLSIPWLFMTQLPSLCILPQWWNSLGVCAKFCLDAVSHMLYARCLDYRYSWWSTPHYWPWGQCLIKSFQASSPTFFDLFCYIKLHWVVFAWVLSALVAKISEKQIYYLYIWPASACARVITFLSRKSLPSLVTHPLLSRESTTGRVSLFK